MALEAENVRSENRPELQHRLGLAALDHDEPDRGDRGDTGGHHGRRTAPLDEGVRRAAEGERREDRPPPVEVARGVRVTRLGDVPQRDQHRDRGERQVDQEDPAPARVVDQRTADERADRRRDPAQPGPRADRRCPVLGRERALDHCQASGGEQGAADPLQHPGRDQDLGVGRQSAERGGRGEPDHPDHEDPPPAEAVPERATEQDQARQRQQIAVRHPLELGEGRLEVLADRPQRDVDDRPVEERHPRAEDRRGDDRATGHGTHPNRFWVRTGHTSKGSLPCHVHHGRCVLRSRATAGRARRPAGGRASPDRPGLRRLQRAQPGRVRGALRARPRLHGARRARGRPQRPRAHHDAAGPAGDRPGLLRRRVAAAGDPARPDPRRPPGPPRSPTGRRRPRVPRPQAQDPRRAGPPRRLPGRLPDALLPDRHGHRALGGARLQLPPRRRHGDGRDRHRQDGHRPDPPPGARPLRLLPAVRPRALGRARRLAEVDGPA